MPAHDRHRTGERCILADGSCLNVTAILAAMRRVPTEATGSLCGIYPAARMARTNDLNRDGRIDDRDALMLLLLWQ